MFELDRVDARLSYIVDLLEKRPKVCYNRDMAYDIKYRLRVIAYWGEGNSKRKTAEVFKVSTSTLQGWKSQLKETGKIEPKKRKPTWRKIEPGKLQRFVEENPDAYLREIADEFDCTIHAVEMALKRVNITRKKNHTV
jgi:transposase